MAQKPGSLVTLKCEGCPCSFTYRLTKSPFRKKFCPDCAAQRTYENKRKFDEKRRNDDIDRARRRQKLKDIPDYEVNPAHVLRAALRV
jgi:hypothetical protein